eukprot:TRINITY_DN22_c2_g1_i1.p1 TRINITY_DN22_c2_g1~~TRINITY_DN22_c2_g1_i1.p1  ORF type:complete len:708 (-),score=225.91 TRINITY_DN22_c2_g1_i1:41-2164(-)
MKTIDQFYSSDQLEKDQNKEEMLKTWQLLRAEFPTDHRGRRVPLGTSFNRNNRTIANSNRQIHSMTQAKTASYGSWASPISSESIVQSGIKLIDLFVDEKTGDVYWTESRPLEGGRYVVVRKRGDAIEDVIPKEANARTRVHEYGGAASYAFDGKLFYVNFADQKIYLDGKAITKEGFRYSDFVMDQQRSRLISVREDHTDKSLKEPVNTVVAVPLDGSDDVVLASGSDFYSTPRVSQDGKLLAYISWNHPSMPWGSTRLNILNLGTLENRVAADQNESCAEIIWNEQGNLFFVTDRREGWWNIHEYDVTNNSVRCVSASSTAEFTGPAWVFGNRHYFNLNSSSILASYSDKNSGGKLAVVEKATGSLKDLSFLPFTSFDYLNHSSSNLVYFIGGSGTLPACVVECDLEKQSFKILKQSFQVEEELRGYISVPKTVEFPTENGLTAFGIYYPPYNVDFKAPEGELPPVLIKIHGGPTARASSTLRKEIQYWTSRGFAILDVDYGGSTGYGREYRNRLNANWGIVDIDDCCNGALHLVKQGLVDKNKLAIDGGSAGGYTTLACMTFRQVFQAGASHYGVSDMEALAHETHKFEARYLDSLVGPYPQEKEKYIARSPIHFVEKINAPLCLFQGTEDKIVPPNQAQMMFDAAKKNGLTVSLTLFEGEQHGFRKSENIKKALDGEYYFYSTVFGFKPAEKLEGIIEIENRK